MSEPHIRKVRPDELEEVWRVHVASSNDLLVRRGRPATRPANAPVASDARAGLASDPDGYFCAVEEGQIRGMVSALVRGRVWYLPCSSCSPATKGGAWGGRCSSGRWPTARRAGRRFAAPGRRSTRAPWLRDGRDGAALAYLPPRWGCRGGDATQGAAWLDPRERELPCDPGAAEKLTAEVFGHRRADDLAHWQGDSGAAVAIERGGESLHPSVGSDDDVLHHAMLRPAAPG